MIRHAHGVRGEVKVASYTEPFENILLYPLRDSNGTVYTLKRTGIQSGVVICRIDGITDRNQAEALKGTELGTARVNLPETDEGETYIHDLIGCRVETTDGQPVGTVRTIANYGAGDIVVMDTADGELMLPYAPMFFPQPPVAGLLLCHLPELLNAGDNA